MICIRPLPIPLSICCLFIPGVDEIEIERLQQRVVVTGDVKPETLIAKLVKSGKKAELWPQKPPEVQESVVSGKEMKSQPTKTEIPAADPSKVTTTTVPSGGDTAGKGGEKVDEGEKVQVDVKIEEKKPETGPSGNTPSPTTVVEKKEQQNEAKSSVVGGGEGKKKKKKKAQNSNKSGSVGETSSIGPPQHIGGGPMPTTIGSNQNIPRHQYQLPRHNYTSPPVYTMSYNTAHPPVNSYTTPHYAPSPPPQSYAYSHFGSEMPPPSNVPPPTQSYAYSHYGYEMAPPPSVPSNYESYRQRSADSFEMFSDENPNGCLVM